MVDLLTPRQTPLPSRPRLEEEIVVDQVNYTLTLCLPEPKSRIGLICANSPIGNIDPLGLADSAVNDTDVNNALSQVYNRMQEYPETMPRAEWAWMMATYMDTPYFDISSEPGTPNVDTFTYHGAEYPELTGTSMSAHELNYLGVGAGFATYGYSYEDAVAFTDAWYLLNHHQLPSMNVLRALLAGYNSFAQLRYFLPPNEGGTATGGGCMDSMPSAFSATLTLNMSGGGGSSSPSGSGGGPD